MATTESLSFGALLRRHRLAAGLTQEALAEHAGVSAKAISDLERDPARTPRLDTVKLLAEALHLNAAPRQQLLLAARTAQESRTGERSLGSMPRLLTPLFGRAGVVEAVAELLRRSDRPDGARLLTLTGIGGVGKTRLAIAATELAAAAFPDGLVFVDLAPLRDPALVLPAIAARLGLDERDKMPLADRLVTALRPQCLLLVLDNFEHLLPAREAVLALLELCPRLVVLTTSRVALRVRGEREYRVAPLEVPNAAATPDLLARSPSVALFLDRARAAGADLTLNPVNVPVVAEICRRLEGLPLAIELAAAWTRLLPPAALLARLERRLPLLAAGPHDLPDRQRTMRDAIAWSYDLLSADEQRSFRCLAVFVGGFTLEAAEQVGGQGAGGGGESRDNDPPSVLPSPSSILDMLAALIDRSLLQSRECDDAGAAEPRFFMLETLREYGLERLAESGEVVEVRQAHATSFLALAETAEPRLDGADGALWGARLEADHDNLQGAVSWSLARRDTVLALRLAGALWRFWSQHGHLSKGRRWLREALALADATGQTDNARVNALIGAAQLAIDQGAYDEAELRSEQAVTLAREREAQMDLVLALNTRGVLMKNRGNYAEAVRCHQEALTLAEALGDQPGAAAALTGLGCATLFDGDVAQGCALCAQSAANWRAIGGARGLAEALLALAVATYHGGALADVYPYTEEALNLFRSLGDTGKIADALWILGTTALAQERYELATARLEQELSLRRERADELGRIQPLSALGLIALRQGQIHRARALLEETLVILERYDDPWARAMSLTILGHVDLVSGDPRGAVTRFAAATSIFAAISNPLYVPWVLEGLAAVAAARGEWDLTARLCGARDALHARLDLGQGVPPADPAAHAQLVAHCREALGEKGFVTARDAGQHLSAEQALNEVEQRMSEGARR